MTRERELELRRMTAAMWEVLLGAKRFGWICQPWMQSANILVRRRPHRDRAPAGCFHDVHVRHQTRFA